MTIDHDILQTVLKRAFDVTPKTDVADEIRLILSSPTPCFVVGGQVILIVIYEGEVQRTFVPNLGMMCLN